MVNAPFPIASFALSLLTPAENLACDEALLDEAAASGGNGLLRFWESPVHFIALGYANKVKEEVDGEACRQAGVPILRRCSGGGTVLQGPGCFNYALILPADETGPLASITGANRFIMERHRDALTTLLGRAVTVEGHTDLALAGRKFSGNAQRRKRTHLLFHGSFLLEDFDPGLIERFLRPPPRQPEYRRGRSHGEFVTRLDVARDAIQSALCRAWNSSLTDFPTPDAAIARLVETKYSRAEWNLRW